MLTYVILAIIAFVVVLAIFAWVERDAAEHFGTGIWGGVGGLFLAILIILAMVMPPTMKNDAKKRDCRVQVVKDNAELDYSVADFDQLTKRICR